MSDEIKIESGDKREFSTGAKRQASAGKGTPVLVPGDAVLDIAKLFERGAEIYSPRNWERGLPLSSILDSLERHLQEEKMGRTDENHARALAWNAVIYLATKLRIAEGILPDSLDDMPDYESVKDAVVIEESIAESDKKTEEETLEEVIAVNENMAGEIAKEVEKITDRDHPDYEGYCNSINCFKKGKANTGFQIYYCPEHEKGD